MSRRVHAHDLFKEALDYGLAVIDGLDNESLDDKESSMVSTEGWKADVFFNEREGTLTLDVDGHAVTLHEWQAWDLLSAIERELFTATGVADHKGD